MHIFAKLPGFYSPNPQRNLDENKKFRKIIFKLDSHTVWRQKKRPKVNECSCVANYRTVMIFFLQTSQESEVFFDSNLFCQEFVCLPFFCPFSPLEGPKKGQKTPPGRQNCDFRYESV